MENDNTGIKAEEPKKAEGGSAALIAILVIVALIALGAYFALKQRETAPLPAPEAPATSTDESNGLNATSSQFIDVVLPSGR